MAIYRTIRMAFWNNPAIEDMPPEQKLLYLYLFTSPNTNNLGVLSVTVRKIAFETGRDEDDVREFLEDLEFDGRIVMEDGDIWVCGFIRHQCSTSPKILTLLRALLPTVESAAIRRAILKRYSHLFGAAPYPSDMVSLPSGESEREKETLIRTTEREIASFAPPVEEKTIPLHLLVALQHDFPDVDVDAEILRIREWQTKKMQPVRNWASFLRTWLSNAVRVRAAHAAPRPVPAVPGAPAVPPEKPAFRTYSEAEKERSRTLRRWSQDHYGKAVALRVGVDMRRPPDESDAPFVALFPDAVATGPGRKTNEYEIGLLIGLSEEGFENREGVMLMTGTLRFAEVWELVRKTIKQAVPGVSLGDVSIEYHLAGYPLVMLDATLTATEARHMIRRVQALLAEGESLLAGLQANVERGK